MAVEAGDNVDGLNPAWPLDADFAIEGAAHVRAVKKALQASVGGSTTEASLKVNNVKRLKVDANSAAVQAANDQPAIKFENAAGTALGEVRAKTPNQLQVAFDNGLEILPTQDQGYRITRGAQTWDIWLEDSDNSLRITDVTNNQVRVEIDPNGTLKLRDSAGAERLAVTTTGITTSGQQTISMATPTNDAHATRKDYVDSKTNSLQSQIDSLQAEINDIKNGFDFTGPISAPSVTQTT